jgi:sigma-E factor negative regulatory protein RseA
MHNTTREQSCDAAELASALADGELHGAELTRALRALEGNGQARECWHAYHLVGDVLRSGSAAAVGAHDAAFVAGVRQRLAQEAARPPRAAHSKASAQPSANDAVWRWKLVAGLSSLAAVVVLGWQLVALRSERDAGAQLARTTPPVSLAAAAAEAPVMIRDPRLDQLIAAHQQQGGTSALQMPAGFLRNATFERPAR